MKYISPTNMANLLRTQRNVIVIDVREDDYQHGRIKDSFNIPFSRIEESRSFPFLGYSAAEVIVFYCHYSQNRGPKAAQIFLSRFPQFVDKVYVLEGGWKAWRELYFEDTQLTKHF